MTNATYDIAITRFHGATDSTTRGPGKRENLTRGQFVAMLMKHDRRTDKSGPGWTPATFVDAPCTCRRMRDGKIICPGERGHRTDENVVEVHALALDIDKTSPDEHGKRHQLDAAGAERAMARLRELGLRYIMHSTHSHAPPTVACYRVVVALSRSIPGADFGRFWRAALAYLDIPHDPASKNAARFWYLPSCTPDAAPVAGVHEGQPLDVDMVMARAIATEARKTAPKPTLRSHVPRDGNFDGLEFMATAYPGVHADDFGGGSTVWDIECPWEAEHSSKGGDRDTIVTRYADGKMGFKCFHAHCEGRTWKDFRRFHQPAWVPFDERPQQPHAPQGKRRSRRGGAVGVATDYVLRFATHPDGPILRRWRGDWYHWNTETGCYTQITDERIEASLYRDLGLTKPADVRDVRAALIGVDGVLIDEVKLGDWIGEPRITCSPFDVAACRNGLLHLPSRRLYPPTPRYFTTTSLGVSYAPEPPEPSRWLAFLHELWPKDDEPIAALQEWFGYLLTPDTRQQKIMLLVGPKRSGKGTIMRVLNALLGEDSVAAPTLASLGTNFGLQPLIGKIAAIIGDARLGGRSDIAQIVERLLSISGQDAQTIDRKHREPWTGYLSARITIVSNELPRLTDASDALASRMLILELGQSFFGKEDLDLTEKLKSELPGILQWAIEGWNRLRERGRFVQPAASAGLKDELEDLASPVAAWVRERCTRGPGCKVECTVAFRDYQAWATEQGHQHKVTLTMFGRDLKAAAQVARAQVREGPLRPWVYRGIGLRELHEVDDAG